MAATIRLNDRVVTLREGETVLDGLDRAGVPVLSSCRSGICQSCLLKVVEGPVPSAAQRGLKESLTAQGYFLACACVPESDLVVGLPGEGLDQQSVVVESSNLGGAVRRVRLSVPEGFQWFAGQYITLVRDDGVARSYSVASCPDDGCLEIHVRRIPGGALSNWLHDDVRSGDPVRFRGAFGDCFYTPGDPEAPLLLAGTGTGLSPLYGILRDAKRHGHRGPIRLFHGALGAEGLYYQDEVRAIASAHDGVEYAACVLRDGNGHGRDCRVGSLDEVVLAERLDVDRERAYLCGDPGIVERLRKKLFLKGLSNRRIFADAFVASVVKQD